MVVHWTWNRLLPMKDSTAERRRRRAALCNRSAGAVHCTRRDFLRRRFADVSLFEVPGAR